MFPSSKAFYIFAIPTSFLAGLGYAHSLHLPVWDWIKTKYTLTNFKKGPPPHFD